MEIQALIGDMKDVLDVAEKRAEKFNKLGTKRAAVDIRKCMQRVKKLAQDTRIAVQDKRRELGHIE